LNSTRQLAEAGIFAGILVVFMMGAFYLPIIGQVMLFFLPLPIAVLAFKNKFSYSILAGIIAAALSAMVVPFFYSFIMGLTAVLTGVPMGYLLKRSEDSFKVVLISGIGAILALILSLWSMQLFLGTSFMDEIELMFSESVSMQQQLTDAATSMGVDITETMNSYSAEMTSLFDAMRMMIPAAILVAGLATAAGNFLMLHVVMRRMKTPLPPLGSFETFSYPKHLAYGSTGMIVLAYGVGYMGWVDVTVLTMNFINLFVTIFMIQGISLAYYYLKRQLGKGVSIAFIVMFMLTGLSYLMSLVGFVDVLTDFRKLRKAQE
jgi:uncharacterized protein YybS (DUF2232 family)